MITDIDDFFSKGCGRCDRFATSTCSTRRWIGGLNALRQICSDAGLAETVKWGHPCYMLGNRNIALLGAFQDDYRITFFNAALLKDPAGLLEKPGPNTRHPNLIRFREDGQAAIMRPHIAAYLQEAIGYAAAGIEAPKARSETEIPSELQEAFESDPELADAFHRLTPGRQRSYAILLSSTKTPATRRSRIAKSRRKIIAGKGANER